MVLIINIVFLSTYDFNLILSFLFHFAISNNMHTFIISLFIVLVTILTFVEVRPVVKFEQNRIRQRRQNQANLIFDQPISPIKNHQMIGNIWNDIQPVLNDHINSHLNESSKSKCERTTNNNGDYIEYCLEKILNQDGKSYSTKTIATLHQIDGTIILLHQAESNIEIDTYNHLNK